MIKAIEKASKEIVRKEKEDELNKARTAAFGYIEKKMTEKDLKDEDLGSYANYREKINNLDEVYKIRSFRESVLSFISKLKRGSNNTGNYHQEQKDNEQKIRGDVHQKIYDRYNSNPLIKEEELEPNLWSSYHDWKEAVQKIEISQLEKFKDQMLTAIDQAREKKQKEHLNHIFEEAKHKEGTDLDEAINKTEQGRGSQAYEKSKVIKEKRATENPQNYRQAAQNKVRENMAKNQVNEQDLDNKEFQAAWNKLKNTEIKEPAVIVEAEMNAIDEIERCGATKKLNEIIKQVQQALKKGTEEDRYEVKTKLLDFISSANVYYQSVYNKRETEIKVLLSKLENYSNSQEPTTVPNKLPLSAALIIISLLLIGLGLFIVIKKKKNFL